MPPRVFVVVVIINIIPDASHFGFFYFTPLYRLYHKGQKDARYILRRLEESGKDEISKRDLFKLVQGRLRRVDAMTPGLAELVKRGYICIQKNSTGGRPTEKITVIEQTFYNCD